MITEQRTVDALRQVAQHLNETAAWLERTDARLEPTYAQFLRVQLAATRHLCDDAWQAQVFEKTMFEAAADKTP